MHHLRTSQTRNRVVLAQKDRLLGSDFFAKTAIDASNHVDFELLGKFFDLSPTIFLWDFAGMNRNRARRTDEFAKLAGDTALFAVLIRHQGRRTAVMRRQMRIPFLFRILHRYLLLAGQDIQGMPDRDAESGEDRRQIDLLRKRKFRAINGVSHANSSFWHKGKNQCGNKYVYQRDFDKEIPTQLHQLIVAEAWESESDPDKEK